MNRAPLLANAASALLLAGFALLGPAAQADPGIVRVRDGDTLEAIALRHGTSIEAIAELNGLADPNVLQVGQLLKLPSSRRSAASSVPAATTAFAGAATTATAAPAAPAPDDPNADDAQAALLLSPAERRDRAEIAQRDLSGQTRWKWFGDTAVDWNGWRLHPGGVRITLVRPAAADVGVRRAGATSVAVQCSSLRQTWRVDGAWEAWSAPAAGSVGLRIVLDLCSNTLDGPAVPVPPPA